MFVSDFGTFLKIGTGASPYTYEKIVGVDVVPPFESEEEKLEVTHHSQESKYRQFIPSGLKDPGDYAFQMRSDPSQTTQQKIFTLYTTGELGHFCIERPDGFVQKFDAYVIGMTYNEADATSPNPVEITVTLAIAGDITEEWESV